MSIQLANRFFCPLVRKIEGIHNLFSLAGPDIGRKELGFPFKLSALFPGPHHRKSFAD